MDWNELCDHLDTVIATRKYLVKGGGFCHRYHCYFSLLFCLSSSSLASLPASRLSPIQICFLHGSGCDLLETCSWLLFLCPKAGSGSLTSLRWVLILWSGIWDPTHALWPLPTSLSSSFETPSLSLYAASQIHLYLPSNTRPAFHCFLTLSYWPGALSSSAYNSWPTQKMSSMMQPRSEPFNSIVAQITLDIIDGQFFHRLPTLDCVSSLWPGTHHQASFIQCGMMILSSPNL